MEIKKLNKELLNDYLDFFDNTPHDDGIKEHRCYCVGYSSADCEEGDDSTAENRRELAKEYVSKGDIQGYLAYECGRVIGWCNTNIKDNCLKSRAGRMYLCHLPIDKTNDKVKSIFCFVIAPDMQRKGVASMLARRVCADALLEGFDYVEAYPNKEFISTQYDYTGPVSMYLKQGFYIHHDLGDRLIMRKKLK